MDQAILPSIIMNDYGPLYLSNSCVLNNAEEIGCLSEIFIENCCQFVRCSLQISIRKVCKFVSL